MKTSLVPSVLCT